ncbi:MAG: sulfatase-like hydrolase/transferase [Gammaproteobacteria bacterium]
MTNARPETRLNTFRRAALVIGALLLINGAITFHNIWPTLGIRWPGELSIEVAVLLLALSISNATLGRTSPRVLALLAVVLVLFAIGRYGEVTAPALYGREINLYWDAQHVSALAGMLTAVAPIWIVVVGAIALVVALALLYLGARWSLGTIDRALRDRRAQIGFGIAAVLLIALFGVQRLDDRVPRVPQFSTPVSHTYAEQISRVLDTFASSRAARALPASPPLQANLAGLDGRDVLVVFMESYGRVTYDRPEIASVVNPAREHFAAAARETGRRVISAFVTSPTFGGSSWFAHSSFLSGINVADPDRYALLLTQDRPTLASTFKAAGYRAVAMMPGLKQNWPEGAFYGFDKIYGSEALDYRGPQFGWWRIPDQFSLAALDAREIQPRPRKPLFVFFPTVNTHMPFRPTPPLQEDWARVLTPTPFDAPDVERSITETPQWTNMGGSYAGSVRYAFEVLASYLRARPSEHFVLVLLGDHQPAANVSGEGASWDVPVQIVSDRPELLGALEKHGFTAGTAPASQAIGPMNELGPMLLGAFSQ